MTGRIVVRCAAKVIAHSMPLALTGCYASGSFIEVPTYKHYYYYAPSVAIAPQSLIKVKQDSRTIDLTFEGSANVLSITTIASRGDQLFRCGYG